MMGNHISYVKRVVNSLFDPQNPKLLYHGWPRMTIQKFILVRMVVRLALPKVQQSEITNS